VASSQPWLRSSATKAAIGKRVTVIDHPDGRLSIRYNGGAVALTGLGG
jgi:hypothetical protein